MIAVHTLPSVKENEEGRWELTLWASPEFDYDAPMRAIVAQVANLFPETDHSIVLPPWEPGEDFIDGHMVAGRWEFDVYIEYALGYIAFYSPEETVMRELERRLSRIVRLGLDS